MFCSNCSLKKSEDCFGTFVLGSKVYTRRQCNQCINKKAQVYRDKNRDKIRQQCAEFRHRHRDKLRKKYKSWNENRKEVGVGARYSKEYSKRNRISYNLRRRLQKALKGNFKTGSAVRDLGCSIEELKIHLESQFQPGMSWENYGEWHIDHIYPLSKVDLTDREQFKKVCHYRNLQPLWSRDNLRKGNKIPEELKCQMILKE